jgi:SAM-dependent methyltransferase
MTRHASQSAAQYAFLVLPAFNRVYGEASVRLSRRELEIFGARLLTGRLGEVGESTIAGLPYITFSADRLEAADLAALANLSSVYALFAREGALLRPLPVQPLDHFDSDLITILKYQGKTNEHFTKLLLNLTLLAAARPGDMLIRRLAVLDPLCGRGTTLNQALMYGYDVAGVEIDGDDFDAYAHFIVTWLKQKRLKHEVDSTAVARNRTHIGRRLDVRFGRSKDLYKQGQVQKVSVVNADTRQARAFFRPHSFDAIVADAPYGVRHGSQQSENSFSRRPLPLLREAVPVWAELLAPGGALGISWNTYLARRQDLIEVLASSGLEVASSAAHGDLSHRVDQAIVRDLVVACKPLGDPESRDQARNSAAPGRG